MSGYSQEFKQQAIDYFNQGHTKTETCKKFNIGVYTFRRWIDPEYHKKCRAKHKSDYYTKPGYKERHNKTISKNRREKMKDPEYRKKNNEYFREWMSHRYHTDGDYKKLVQKRVSQRQKWRYHNEPEYNLKTRLRVQLRQRIKTKNVTERMDELIGCSIKQLKEHIEDQFTEGMSWDNILEWHVDHIKPCTLFDLTNVAEQRKCFHYSNLQPLWAEENIKKSDNY